MALCVQYSVAAPSYLETVVLGTVNVPSCVDACSSGMVCEVIGQPVPPALEAGPAVEAFSEGFLIAVVPLLAAFSAALVVQAVRRF